MKTTLLVLIFVILFCHKLADADIIDIIDLVDNGEFQKAEQTINAKLKMLKTSIKR